MTKTIGQLIEEEVRRQGRSITAFADEICCTRTNVYDIFQRSKMDVAQLELISKVLGRNFFRDLAENPALADASNPEVERDLQNRRAVAQFFDVMPKVLRGLDIETSIAMTIMKNEFDVPLPDYGLTDYAIYFTVGDYLVDRFKRDELGFFDIQSKMTDGDQRYDIWFNKVHRTWSINLMLDYKTEQEWTDIIRYVLEHHVDIIKMPDLNYSRL